MIAQGLLGRLRPRRSARASPARSARAGASRRGAPVARRGPWVPKRLWRLALLLLACGVVLTGAWLGLRDSSLVAVRHVTITGESGPDAGQIRSALLAAARNMTTLDVRLAQLRTAVAPYPVVKDVQVSTHFPHGLSIHVIEQIPVAAVLLFGRTVPVSADGTLLHDVGPSPSVPIVQLQVPPGGSRLTDPGALRAVALLAAAPYQLLSRISQVIPSSPHGPIAQVRNGPVILFGDSTRPAAKWIAASVMLAARGSVGAGYIDVSDPGRPAAGPSTSATSGGGTGAGSASATTGTTPNTTVGP